MTRRLCESTSKSERGGERGSSAGRGRRGAMARWMRLGHPEERRDEIGHGHSGRTERRRPHPEATEGPAERRAEHESQPDAGPEPSHPAGALLALGHVGDRGLARREVAGRRPGKDARREEQRQERHRRGEREQHHRRRVAREAEQDHLAATDPVREAPEEGRRHELRERERREQKPDRAGRAAHRLHVEREERDHDPEPDEVEKDRQEDERDDARRAGHVKPPARATAPQGTRRASLARARIPAESCARAPYFSRNALLRHVGRASGLTHRLRVQVTPAEPGHARC